MTDEVEAVARKFWPTLWPSIDAILGRNPRELPTLALRDGMLKDAAAYIAKFRSLGWLPPTPPDGKST